MPRRVYEELRSIVEQEGGHMTHERAGHGPGGAWVVTLRRTTKVFRSNGRGFPHLDRLYVPAKPNPSHHRDYTTTLVKDARDRWLKMLKQ